MSVNWISIKQIRISSVFFSLSFYCFNNHHIGNSDVCSFSLAKKIEFRRCFNLFNRKYNADNFFCVCCFQLHPERCLCNSKTSLPKFYLHPKSSTVKSYPITFLSCCFFISLFFLFKSKETLRLSILSIPSSLEKEPFFVFKWREIVSPLCANDLNFSPFFLPLLSFEFWP